MAINKVTITNKDY